MRGLGKTRKGAGRTRRKVEGRVGVQERRLVAREEQRKGKGKTRSRKGGEMRESFSKDTPHRKRERRVDGTGKNRDKFTLHEFHRDSPSFGRDTTARLGDREKGRKRMTKK